MNTRQINQFEIRDFRISMSNVNTFEAKQNIRMNSDSCLHEINSHADILFGEKPQ